jgi:hypothetical protein
MLTSVTAGEQAHPRESGQSKSTVDLNDWIARSPLSREQVSRKVTSDLPQPRQIFRDARTPAQAK